MDFHDQMFDLEIGFNLAALTESTYLNYSTKIIPKSFLGKIMKPLIRLGTRKKIQKELQSLKLILGN